MIPKIIHYCWFGYNQLPPFAVKCLESWKKYLPDYEIKEWNENNFDVNIIPYTREAYRMKKYAFVSDYARFWILYKYGGVYFDTDVEVIKPMDDIIERGAFMGCELAPMGLNGRLEPAIATGLGLGAEQHNVFLGKILNFYAKSHLYSYKGLIKETVVGIVTRLMMSNNQGVDLSKICYINDIYIYPIDYFGPIVAKTGEMNITANTRSIHHYSATWVTSLSVPRWKRALSRVSCILTRIYVQIFSFLQCGNIKKES